MDTKLGEWQVNNPEYVSGTLQSIRTIYDCIKYHKQQHTVDKYPKKGSCLPTAIACMLKIELHEIPHFNLLYFDHAEFLKAKEVFTLIYNDNATRIEDAESLFYQLSDKVFEIWMASKGLYIKYVEGSFYLENKDKPYMVYGKANRGVPHVVIYMNGKMIHDPHPSNDGLVSVDRYAIVGHL